MHSGLKERLPYSLSRWTDLPAGKWEWFRGQLGQGYMMAIDPRSGIPGRWSLAPEDTLGLIFWTRNPENLLRDRVLLESYSLVVHMTLTGWHEVEPAAPSLGESLDRLKRCVETFGARNVTWRFSPVPAVPDVVDRFRRIATEVGGFVTNLPVYLSFLQENDLIPETRALRVQREITQQLHRVAKEHNLNLLVCAENRVAETVPVLRGVCESGARFWTRDNDGELYRGIPLEHCGCAKAVDPFTVNESCVYGCAYCYAANRDLSPKKFNTTKART